MIFWIGWWGFSWRLNENLVVCFRTPVHKPLFSERNGYIKHVFKVGGFRLWMDER